ncbi:MAG: hypothetical protein ACK5HM_15070 [Gemmatimonas sp.]|jgi:hypothetical protein|uniref:hypothetical protein n=1 Tax=Gemmatimonas sp. TaxID=1962908 RepID=UPI00391B644B
MTASPHTLLPIVLASAVLSLAGATLGAQPPVGSPPPAKAAPVVPAAVPDSTRQAIESFAKLQLALNGLRDREQAELAEPRNKKVETQAELRTKHRALRADTLKAHGFTPAQVSAMTLRLSGDDALRALFESTMERLAK